VTVIPAMDHIDEVLATNTLDTQFSLAIKAALTMCLNCYYSKTNLSDVYRIAMSTSISLVLLLIYIDVIVVVTSLLIDNHKG
jgi:hypothetical protein